MVDEREVVDALGRLAGDEHARGRRRRSPPARSRSRRSLDRLDRARLVVVADRERLDDGQAPLGVRLHRRVPKRRVRTRRRSRRARPRPRPPAEATSPSSTTCTVLTVPTPNVALERDEALLGRVAVRHRAQAREAALEVEHRRGEREQQPTLAARLATGRRITRRARRPRSGLSPAPDAWTNGMRSALTRSPSRLSTAGSSVSAATHRDDADEDGARREAAQDRVRDEHHAGQRDDERAAAEEHGAARGRARGGDRFVLVEPGRALLAVAREHEERVVDAERQPHPGQHVHDEDREVERLPDQGSQRERDDDRDDARAAAARAPRRRRRRRAGG